MEGEKFEEWARHDQKDWVLSSEKEYNKREAEENVAVSKIERNPKAKDAFKKLVAKALLVAVVVGSGVALNKGIDKIKDKTEGAKTLSLQEVADDTLRFMDIHSGDLTWMLRAEDEDGGTASVSRESFNDDLARAELGEISRVDIAWWEGEGDMYSASDVDGDGAYDTAEKINASTGESASVEIPEDVVTAQGVQGLFE